MKKCEVCEVPTSRGRARCDSHPRYRRADPGNCDVCGKKAYRMRLCWEDFKKIDNPTNTCSLAWCSEPSYSRRVSFCVTHYNRWRLTGDWRTPERFRLVDSTCQQCGIGLNTKNTKTTLFCTNRCRKRYARGRVEVDRTCFMCDNVISKEDSLRKKFCSKSCADRARTGNNDNRFSDGTVTRPMIEELFKFYGTNCINPFCTKSGVGKFGRVSKDHIIALSNGGSHSVLNLQPLCLRCNIQKATHTIDYRFDLGVKFEELLREKDIL